MSLIDATRAPVSREWLEELIVKASESITGVIIHKHDLLRMVYELLESRAVGDKSTPTKEGARMRADIAIMRERERCMHIAQHYQSKTDCENGCGDFIAEEIRTYEERAREAVAYVEQPKGGGDAE